MSYSIPYVGIKNLKNGRLYLLEDTTGDHTYRIIGFGLHDSPPAFEGAWEMVQWLLKTGQDWLFDDNPTFTIYLKEVDKVTFQVMDVIYSIRVRAEEETKKLIFEGVTRFIPYPKHQRGEYDS